MIKHVKLNGRRAAVANAPTSAAAATITAERVARSIRTRFDPLPSLNPRLLAQYLQQFEYGYLEPAARTFDAMERRDDRLASVAGKARNALARYGFEVLIADGNFTKAQKAEAQRHKVALEFLYGNCTATNAVREDETGGFSLLVRQMADAIGKRYSVHEIVWEPREDGTLTATFRHAPLWFFEAITGKLRFKPQDGVAEGVPMDPDAWLVTVGDGIMEACAVLWMFKHLPLRDWLGYSEKFGMPYLLGKTGAAFNSAEWNAMAAALRGFGSDGAAVIGGADDIVPVQAGVASESTPFPGLVERSDQAMSILWRGADLGTQSHSGTGKGQGASLQEDETAALDEDRAAWLTESLLPVSRTAIRYLFGPGATPLAYVRIKTSVRKDIQLDLAVDAFLLNNGAPLSLAGTLERYGRPLPGPGETLLHPSLGGGAKGAASEDTVEASLERAANGAAERVTAENFNPNHGEDGRFTSGDGAEGGRQSKSPKKIDSISKHQYPKDRTANQKAAICFAASLQTMIATMLGKDAPDIEKIKEEVNAAKKALPGLGGDDIDWNKGIEARPSQLAAIAQTVLSENGLDPTVVQGNPKSSPVYSSAKDLADAIAATDQPVMFNVGGSGDEQHAVTAQRKGDGDFLVNNLNRDGQTQTVSERDMEGGTLTATRYTDPRDVGSGKTSYSHIKYQQPVIFGGKS